MAEVLAVQSGRWVDEGAWADDQPWRDEESFEPRPPEEVTGSLLPLNATALERAIEGTMLAQPPVANAGMWDPWRCPAPLLPWLAHSLSVDAWEPGWTEETKRRVIASSVQVHRVKGTRASIRTALRAAGLGDVVIVEGADANLYNGAALHDGTSVHSVATTWAEYVVFLSRPVSIAQANQARRILARVAPVRCRLRALNFSQVAHLHNRVLRYDGTFTHGAA